MGFIVFVRFQSFSYIVRAQILGFHLIRIGFTLTGSCIRIVLVIASHLALVVPVGCLHCLIVYTRAHAISTRCDLSGCEISHSPGTLGGDKGLQLACIHSLLSQAGEVFVCCLTVLSVEGVLFEVIQELFACLVAHSLDQFQLSLLSVSLSGSPGPCFCGFAGEYASGKAAHAAHVAAKHGAVSALLHSILFHELVFCYGGCQSSCDD